METEKYVQMVSDMARVEKEVFRRDEQANDAVDTHQVFFYLV
jgi:hypothetical protein